MAKSRLISYLMLASGAALLPMTAAAQDATKLQQSTQASGSEHHKPTSKYYDTIKDADTVDLEQKVRAHDDRMTNVANTGHDKNTTMRVDFIKSPSAHRLDISELNTPPEPPVRVRGSGAGKANFQDLSVTRHSDYDSRAMGNGYGHPTATANVGGAIVKEPMPRGHDKRWSYAFETGHDAPTSATVTLIRRPPEEAKKPARLAHQSGTSTLIFHRLKTSSWAPDVDVKTAHITDVTQALPVGEGGHAQEWSSYMGVAPGSYGDLNEVADKLAHDMDKSNYMNHHDHKTTVYDNVNHELDSEVRKKAKKLRSVKE